MRRSLSGLVLAIFLIAPLARADQCELVAAEVATRAVAAIQASHGRVLLYCALCDDPEPTLGAAFTPRSVVSTGQSVVIDGREIDLAYAYLEVAPNVFENIAMRSGCDARDVPEVLRFHAGALTRARFSRAPAALTRLGWGRPLPVQHLLPPG